MKLLAIYVTANGPPKLTDGSITNIFAHKEQKKSGKGDYSTCVFLLIFRNFEKQLLLRTLTVAASEDEDDETKLLHITSRLKKCYL